MKKTLFVCFKPKFKRKMVCLACDNPMLEIKGKMVIISEIETKTTLFSCKVRKFGFMHVEEQPKLVIPKISKKQEKEIISNIKNNRVYVELKNVTDYKNDNN